MVESFQGSKAQGYRVDSTPFLSLTLILQGEMVLLAEEEKILVYRSSFYIHEPYPFETHETTS